MSGHTAHKVLYAGKMAHHVPIADGKGAVRVHGAAWANGILDKIKKRRVRCFVWSLGWQQEAGIRGGAVSSFD